MNIICYRWVDANITWSDANWLWSLCFIPVPVTSGSLQPPGVDATTLIQPWLIEPWNPYKSLDSEKRKRLIKLICKVKGQSYEEEKLVSESKISVDDVKMVIKKVFNIDLDIKKPDK